MLICTNVLQSLTDMNVNDFCDAEVPAAKLTCDLPCPEPPTLSPSSKQEAVSSVPCSSGGTCGLFDSQPPSLVPNKDSSDMELTLIESASKETHTHECTSLLSPSSYLQMSCTGLATTLVCNL